MFDSIVHLSAMKKILEMPQVRSDPPEAARIIGRFVWLGFRVFLKIHSCPSNPGWRRVHEDLSPLWPHHISNTNISDDSRGCMQNLNLRRTIRGLWKLTRHYHRTGRSGFELWVEVCSHLISFATASLGMTLNDPVWNGLIFELVDRFSNRRMQPLHVQEEGTNEKGDWVTARMTAVLAVSELQPSGDRDCNICYENVENSVEVKVGGHYFCADCLETWMHDGEGATHCCPMCRSPLS